MKSHDPNDEAVQLNPWLITLGIIAVLVGVFVGLVMSQATWAN